MKLQSPKLIPISKKEIIKNEIRISFDTNTFTPSQSSNRRIMIRTNTMRCASEALTFIVPPKPDARKSLRSRTKTIQKFNPSTKELCAPTFSYPFQWTHTKNDTVTHGTIESEKGWELQEEDTKLLTFALRHGKYLINFPANSEIGKVDITSLNIRSPVTKDQDITIHKVESLANSAIAYSFSLPHHIKLNIDENYSHIKSFVVQTSTKEEFRSEDFRLFSYHHKETKKRKVDDVSLVEK